MAGASRDITIDARPETVFQTVTDYEAYPELFDEIVDIQVLSRTDHSADVEFTVEIVKKRLKYTLRLEHLPPETMRWSLVEGDFKKNDGSWQIRPLDGGKRSHVTYSVEIDLGMFVPKFIINSLVGANMPKMLEAVKTRAEKAEAKS